MSTMTAAILGTLVYWIISCLDPYTLSWQCLNRPIVVAPIVGLVLGDFHTGIVMGASLESIFMGISAIGGSVPSDALSASVIAVTYTVLTGSNAEAGLAIALPIGTVMASFNGMLTPVWASLAPYWEKLAVTNSKKFVLHNFLFSFFVMPIPGVIALFLGLAYGVDGLNNLLATLPPFVMTGLGAASSMMIAVGFAILTSMIWSKEVGVFFFVGYILSKVLKLDSLSIAVLGAAIAMTLFFTEKKIIDMKNSFKVSGETKMNEEEDFF